MGSLAVANLPGLRPLPLLGSRAALIRLFADPLRTLPRLHAEFGDIAAMCRGDASVVCVFGPAYNQQILPNAQLFEVSTDLPVPLPEGSAFARLSEHLARVNGGEHRRLRRLLTPAFSKPAISGYRDTMVEIISAHLDRWRPGEDLDLAAAMHELTLDVMSACLFGVTADPQGENLVDLAARFLRGMSSPATMLLPVDLPFLPFGRHLRLAEALEARMLALIESRRREGLEGRRDAFSLLLAANEQVEGEAPLSEAEIVANAALLFLAGYETTANGLISALMLLAQHPQVQVDLRAELDARLHGAAPSLDDLADLPLLSAVVDEALRMLPASFIIFLRRSSAAIELGPHQIPAGATFVLSPLVTHHMPEVWPEPRRFSPQRWLERKPTPFEFIPFGGGTRRCIGAAFSEQEMRLALAQIIQRFALALHPGQRIDYVARGITMGVANPIRTRLLSPAETPRTAADIDGQIRNWVDW